MGVVVGGVVLWAAGLTGFGLWHALHRAPRASSSIRAEPASTTPLQAMASR